MVAIPQVINGFFEESTLDVNGDLLKMEWFSYKGNLLIEKVDAMGLKTSYQYDSAGRKVAEVHGSRVTRYTYDDFGHVATIEYPLGAIETYTYDFLGRVISKTQQDRQGKIYSKELYTFDILGNEIEKKCLQKDDKWIFYRSGYGSDGKIL